MEFYSETLSETKETLIAANQKGKKGDIEKQAVAHARREVKASREAKFLQHRVAMKAEYMVQKSIQSAMEKFNIPVHVFRGVNTLDDIGQLLEGFDVKMSKLKAFKSGDADKHSLECEHDIGAMALLPTGPLVSFVQVELQSISNCVCLPSGEDQ